VRLAWLTGALIFYVARLIDTIMATTTSLVLLLVLTTTCNAFAAGEANGKLQLKYFNARGVAETCRILLAIGQEPYDDIRFDITPGKMESPDFNKAKETGHLKLNLDRAPVLVTPDGVTIGQSKSIERYLARRFSLMGSTSEEAALIDCVGEHCRDVRDAQMRKSFSFFARGKTDEEKAVLRKEWFETDMPALLKKIDTAVQETGSPGYAVGRSLTYADVAIFCLLKDCSPADQDETAKVAAKCEALKAIADNVVKDTRVSTWLESRPPSNF
jgi:glutathione S-transferase